MWWRDLCTAFSATVTKGSPFPSVVSERVRFSSQFVIGLFEILYQIFADLSTVSF